MKKKVLKQDLIDRILEMDTRTRSWDQGKMDTVITNAFVELSTVSQPFSAEYSEDLVPYYENGEFKSSVTIDDSVISIYDFYLVKYDQNEELFTRGEMKFRNINVIWKNPQSKDTILFNLKSKYCGDYVFDNIVAKYFYLPLDANFTELYLFTDEYLALRAALEVAVYEETRDYETAVKKREKLIILGQTLIEDEPDDFPVDNKRKIFDGYIGL